jgi:hypothetical protein
MTYDDGAWTDARNQLDEAIWTLLANEEDAASIHQLVDDSIKNWDGSDE